MTSRSSGPYAGVPAAFTEPASSSSSSKRGVMVTSPQVKPLRTSCTAGSECTRRDIVTTHTHPLHVDNLSDEQTSPVLQLQDRSGYAFQFVLFPAQRDRAADSPCLGDTTYDP